MNKRNQFKPGDRIPALVAVLATEVATGARVWGYQEPSSRDPRLFAGPHTCQEGARVDSGNPAVVWLGEPFGDADPDALILVEQ